MKDGRYKKGAKWPSWRYGPGGAEKLCKYASEVPEGWVDHPKDVVEPSDEPAKESAPTDTKPPAAPAAKPRGSKAAPVKEPATPDPEARRLELLVEARKQYPDVPDTATLAELEAALAAA